MVTDKQPLAPPPYQPGMDVRIASVAVTRGLKTGKIIEYEIMVSIRVVHDTMNSFLVLTL